MTPQTAQALAEINRRFYGQTGAEDFDRTRSAPWPGFELLAAQLDRARAQRVLDVGCGNGRLGHYLYGALQHGLDYSGIDASEPLLARARETLGADARLARHDLMLDPDSALPPGPFTCISLIAVLHHIPGRTRRAALVAALSERLAPEGLLVLTAWRFDRIERVRSRMLPPERCAALAGASIDPNDLERGDYLIPWGTSDAKVRYCHLIGDDELMALAALPGTRCTARHDADGTGGDYNSYLMLRRGGTVQETRPSHSPVGTAIR